MQEDEISKREFLEEQSNVMLQGYKVVLLDRITETEQEVELINDILEGRGEDPTPNYEQED